MNLKFIDYSVVLVFQNLRYIQTYMSISLISNLYSLSACVTFHIILVPKYYVIYTRLCQVIDSQQCQSHNEEY